LIVFIESAARSKFTHAHPCAKIEKRICIGGSRAVADRQPKFGEEFETLTRKETKKPSLYKVFLLNDDYTTMDFVVQILESVFHKSSVEATQIMLHVHKKGLGLAGVYTRGIAETKVTEVRELARKKEFPLKCIIEKE
jgi:ATP-dependent Clp protease adaptor protein ClpS